VVVEKEGVFHRLVEEQFPMYTEHLFAMRLRVQKELISLCCFTRRRVNCVLVSGCGKKPTLPLVSPIDAN
jgi:hypothetical protein